MRPPQSYGGPGSFQTRLEKFLSNEKYSIEYFSEKRENIRIKDSVIIVFSSSKYLFWLFKARIKRTKIILRLDGINWEQRFRKLGLRYTIKAYLDNFITFVIANTIASDIVYQSHFVKKEWGRYVKKSIKSHVIYNGVQSNEYFTRKDTQRNGLIMVAEGELYSDPAISILNKIEHQVNVYGKCSSEFKAKVNNSLVHFKGVVSRTTITEMLPKYSAVLSLELCPACPNIVIEAQMAGTPILCYDTGSIKELVHPILNPIMKYGACADLCQTPQMDHLNIIGEFLLKRFNEYAEIQLHAKSKFEFEIIGENYLKVIEGVDDGL